MWRENAYKRRRKVKITSPPGTVKTCVFISGVWFRTGSGLLKPEVVAKMQKTARNAEQ